MSSAYWAFDWPTKFREMDLDEVLKVESSLMQVKQEKLHQAIKRNEK
jgi:hypothetical protein